MSTFHYNQSGEARKPFVKTVSGILGAKPRYMGTPTYSYQIGVATVTREGDLQVDECIDTAFLEKLIERLAERGYEPEPVEASKEDTVEETETVEAVEPSETSHSDEDEASPESDDISMTVSLPRSIMTDSGIDNLKKLVWAKGELLKQAFDIDDTEIVVTEEAINFPWFGKLDPEELKLTVQFISGLCKFANASKRVTSKPRHEDNPKFTMRVWLIRMGFDGAEYKDLRRFMLKHLPGDAAFRYGRPDAQGSLTDETHALGVTKSGE